MSGVENSAFKVKFLDVMFCLRKVQLTPHKFQEIQQGLEESPASYPVNRVKFKTHSIAAGPSYLNWIMLYFDSYQTRKFIDMVDNTSDNWFL